MGKTINQFSRELTQQFYAFYLLEHIVEDKSIISAYVNTGSGEVPAPIRHEIVRIPDGRLVACIDATSRNLKYNNLIFRNKSSYEIVNLQIFERIMRYVQFDGRNDSRSHFFFYNSIPITTDIDIDNHNIGARCDIGLMGPETFMKNESTIVPLIDYRGFYIYEPILSINGIGHLGFAQSSSDIDYLSSGDSFPRCALTMQESLKQICEWAAVNNAPWDNSEQISHKASLFLNELRFNENEISHIHSSQPDMQIFRYLRGFNDAKIRPHDPGVQTAEIVSSIQRRLAHWSISNFTSIHNIDLGSDLLNDCKLNQNNIALETELSILRSTNINLPDISEDNIDIVKDAIFKHGMVHARRAASAETVLALKLLNG